MRFRDVVAVYQEVESTAKRLEMTDHLVSLFREVDPGFIDKVVYLTQGDVAPEFEDIKMGLGEKLVIRALAKATGLGEDEVDAKWKELGDLGTVGEAVVKAKRQRTLTGEPLTVAKVHGNLVRIARAAGPGSQEEKLNLLADLVSDATVLEVRYLLRIVVGKMRLGVAEMTIVDALAAAFATKEDRGRVERAFNVSSDLGRVARVLATEGLEGLEAIQLEVGVPVRSMLCERLPSLEEVLTKLGTCALEYKYDGLRLQAHVDGDGIRLWSRRLENLTAQFPDVVASLGEAFVGEAAILDGEAVPVDLNTGTVLPFQEVSHRRRKYGIAEVAEEIPVVLLLFDCLHRDGTDLLQAPYRARREALDAVVTPGAGVRLVETEVTDDLEEAETFFEAALERGCEGLIAKDLDSPYEAGSRGWQWIKYKRDYRAEMADTVDLVIVGAFAGRGRRGGTYGALLMAAYDAEEDLFRTVCKLGSGFDDETLFALPARLREFERGAVHPRVDSELEADAWFDPAVVLEVLGAEITLSPTHTCGVGAVKEDAGLAIRFPRYTGRWRDDKGPRDATTAEEVVSMYRNQLKKVS